MLRRFFLTLTILVSVTSSLALADQRPGSDARSVMPVGGRDPNGKTQPFQMTPSGALIQSYLTLAYPAFTSVPVSQVAVSQTISGTYLRNAALYAMLATNDPVSGSIYLQASADGASWVNLGTAVAVPSSPNMWGISPIAFGSSSFNVQAFPYLRLVWAPSTVVVQSITVTADDNGSLAGKYFLASGAQQAPIDPYSVLLNGRGYAFWYKVSGAGSVPVDLPAGYTPWEIDITTNDSAATVASATAAAMGRAAYSFYTSPDGISWTPSPPNSGSYTNIAYNGSVYCAVGVGANTLVGSSTDGSSWTARSTNIPASKFQSVVWNGSYFLLTTNTGTSYATSPDCVNFTTRTNPGSTSLPWRAAWSPTLGLWAAVIDGATGYSSTDGAAWTSRTSLLSGKSIAWGNGTFCASPGSNAVLYSTNGTSFSSKTLTGVSVSVGFDGVNFLVAGSSAYVLNVSSDCQNWVTVSTPINSVNPDCFARNSTTTIGITTPSSTKTVWRSTDDAIWTVSQAPVSTAIGNVANSAPLCVMWDGTKFWANSYFTAADFTANSSGALISVSVTGGVIPARDGTSGFSFGVVAPPASARLSAWVVGG